MKNDEEERRRRRNQDLHNQKPSASTFLTQIPTNPDLPNPNPLARTEPSGGGSEGEGSLGYTLEFHVSLISMSAAARC